LREQSLRRILLVDDDPDLVEVVSLALVELGGYTVRVCPSADEALEKGPSFQPDLILLDFMLPGTDGFALLQALRRIEETARVPVVFMTAAVQREDFSQYDRDCIGVIPKPFDPTVLPDLLEALWVDHVDRIREAHRQRYEALRLAYVDQLEEKITAMQDAAAALAARGWDRPTLESLHLLVHRMAGSCGLYRLNELSRRAGALEEIVKRLLNAPVWPPSGSPVELTTLVKAVSRTARTEAGLSPAPRASS
jgi:two-component system, OmpR family, response regulator